MYYTAVVAACVSPGLTVRNAHLLHMCHLGSISDHNDDSASGQQVRTAFWSGCSLLTTGHAAYRVLQVSPNPHAWLPPWTGYKEWIQALGNLRAAHQVETSSMKTEIFFVIMTKVLSSYQDLE